MLIPHHQECGENHLEKKMANTFLEDMTNLRYLGTTILY